MIDETLSWSDRVAREEAVRRWTEAGLSSGQIAQKYGITRNAVIGVQNRMGLSRKRAKPSPVEPFKPKRLPGWENQPRASKAETKPKRSGNVPMRMPLPVPFKAPAPEAAVAPDWPPIDMMALTRTTCRWPLDGLYCGGPALDGRPYCAFHTQKASRNA